MKVLHTQESDTYVSAVLIMRYILYHTGDSNASNDSGTSGAATAGIVVGVSVATAIVIATIVLILSYYHHRKNKKSSPLQCNTASK